MILTIDEIKDLAIYAGYAVTGGIEDPTSEFIIHSGPCLVIDHDSGESKCYQHVATCDGCSGSEVQPLGHPISNK